jgi:prolyl-tRNA editing enzyme YbaK/EbsC (Cys-tRNA(Pro) deacylase)
VANDRTTSNDTSSNTEATAADKFDTPNVRRVKEALLLGGLAVQIKAMEESARTAQMAADAIGCQVAQIVKSLVFKAQGQDLAVLALVSGANRLDEQLVEAQLGFKLEKANAAFVRDMTGFAIGGVAPVGHLKPSQTIIDQDLLLFETIWAAAGHPNTVFPISPPQLIKLSAGKVMVVHS